MAIFIIHLDSAVVVEGKYDKIKLKNIFDAVIIVTDGFRIYKDAEKMSLIRRFAETEGIIILTDSDTAGFRIRRYLKGAVNSGRITNVYIPDIFGRERRKRHFSKEGKLGVEGVDEDIIIEAFRRAGININGSSVPKPSHEIITSLDMYELGLSGGKNSSEKRKAVLKQYGLPQLLTTASMTEILNTMTTRTEFIKQCEKLFSETGAADTEE